jgi:NAD(P)-dependent dehydrogenase (short-subunit alcohol dehydrogenase family)
MQLPQTPSFRLDGRRAVISGAGRGIGRAAAAALANAGAEVTLLARTHSEIEACAAQIRTAGGAATAVPLDVADIRAVQHFFESHPAFHVLVNNAGVNRPRPFLEVTMEDFDAVVSINLRSAFFVAQACAQQMKAESVAGSLIHMSSQMGHVGGGNRSLYCASKWALEGLNKSLAVDLAPFRIRSNTIAPTFIETPLSKPFLESAQFKAEVLTKIKLNRLGQVEDLMGAIIYLASDASLLMTGSSMVIDGGWTAD